MVMVKTLLKDRQLINRGTAATVVDATTGCRVEQVAKPAAVEGVTVVPDIDVPVNRQRTM